MSRSKHYSWHSVVVTLGYTQALANKCHLSLKKLYSTCICRLSKATPYVRVNFSLILFTLWNFSQKRGFLPSKDHLTGKQKKNFPTCTSASWYARFSFIV